MCLGCCFDSVLVVAYDVGCCWLGYVDVDLLFACGFDVVVGGGLVRLFGFCVVVCLFDVVS